MTSAYILFIITIVSDNTLHRFYVNLYSEEQWYNVIREANRWFGKNWRGQSHVKRKFKGRMLKEPIKVWFEVPDQRFDAWVALKCPPNGAKDPVK